MNFVEYSALVQDDVDLGLDSSLTVTESKTFCAVDDIVVMRLRSVSPKYRPGDVIPIYHDNRAFADLLVTEGEPFGYGRASAVITAAYLLELSLEWLGSDQSRRDFIFQHSYVALNRIDFDDYVRDLRSGSGVWGSFVHEEDQHSRIHAYRTRIFPLLLPW
jgi:hypothetical protein